MTTERENVFHILGNPVTLLGPEIRVGDPAPDFTVVTPDLQPMTLSDSAGKTRIILAFPSLDTDVCDIEARKFAERASEIPGVEILAISVDLPFAQKRWCGAAGVDNLSLGSDHRDVNFGLAYGVLIKDSRQLARAAWVVDADGRVTYAELVPEMADQPDYDAVIAAAKAASA